MNMLSNVIPVSAGRERRGRHTPARTGFRIDILRTLLGLSLALPFILWTAPAAGQEKLRNYRSKEALVKSNAPSSVSKTLAKRIDNFCKNFDAFFREMKLDKKNDNKIVLRLFNTYDEYADFYRTRMSADRTPPAAYFSRSFNAIALYNNENDIYLRQVLFHECSHQYFYRYTYEAPRWLKEGLAEYFEGWRLKPDGNLIKKRAHPYDLTCLQEDLNSKKTLPLKTLLTMPDKTFYDFKKNYPEYRSNLNYLMAWGLVYFCLEGPDEENRRRMVQYIRDLNRIGENAEFRVDDYEALEEIWREWILSLEAEREDAQDHMLVAAGYRVTREWEKAIEEFEKALELDPEIPGAHYWLGYCCYQADHYEKAAHHLEIACAETPEEARPPYRLARVHLLLEKGKVSVETSQALRWAEEAVKRSGGKSPFYLSFLADCRYHYGQAKEAVKILRKVLKIEKDEKEKARYRKKLEVYRKGSKKK